MARFKWKKREEKKDPRPAVTDDFIYDEPRSDAASSVASDTPEDALRKLRGDPEVPPGFQPAEDSPETVSPESPKESPAPVRHVTSTGIELDENLQPVETGRKRKKKKHPVLRRVGLTVITLVLILSAASYIFHRIIPTAPILGAPENVIGQVVTPVQGFFSGLTEGIAGYFRTLKLRANIESEYNALRAENERLVYQAMLAEELQNTLRQYEDLSDEIAANAAMRPIVCTVIGKTGDSYFSTFTINRGRNDGIKEYMAVTLSGALVGYTETVTDNQATVRTIIDSEASIAALIQSSRDQGTIRGTLGVDGTAMCRMYYLPDDHLPRPGDVVVTSGVSMSFPRGIPIGTVRESTRGMDANKQYIVVEPSADFQHIEHVIVLRYQPQAGEIQSSNTSTQIELVPLETARPYPTLRIGSLNYFTTDVPEDYVEVTETPSPTPSPSPTPRPTSTPISIDLSGRDEVIYEYAVVTEEDPNITPTPTPSPSPTPYITLGADDMTLEEED